MAIEICLTIIILLLLALYLGAVFFIVNPHRRILSHDISKKLSALQIPATGIERHQALKSDPSMLERIKKAAKLKVHRPKPSLIENYLSASALSGATQRYLTGTLLILMLLGMTAFGAYVGSSKGIVGALAGILGGAFLAVLIGCIAILERANRLNARLNL